MAEAGPAAEFTHFTLMVTGQIESGRYEGLDTLYCRYTFAFGDDWKVVSGVEEGITQLSTASGTGGEQGLLAAMERHIFLWVQEDTSSISARFARSPVHHGTRLINSPEHIALFDALTAFLLANRWRLSSWLAGMRPEFIDSLFPAKGEGRDVTRVQSFGAVKLQLDVTIQGQKERPLFWNSICVL
ncbi:MAG: hypothetical protein SGPRY_004982 [Prymnesium sp.]